MALKVLRIDAGPPSELRVGEGLAVPAHRGQDAKNPLSARRRPTAAALPASRTSARAAGQEAVADGQARGEDCCVARNALPVVTTAVMRSPKSVACALMRQLMPGWGACGP